MDVKHSATAITAMRMPSLFVLNLNYVGISMEPNSEENRQERENRHCREKEGRSGVSYT